jgi:hypothetical protein
MVHSYPTRSQSRPQATALRRGTVNIFSSSSHQTTYIIQAVTKLDHVVAPTTKSVCIANGGCKGAEPVEYGRGDIVISGNTFGECVMINVGSPNCIGACQSIGLSEQEHAFDYLPSVKQTALTTQINRSI